MPALITGNRLSAVEHDDCDLALTVAKTGKTSDWSATPTIFSKARSWVSTPGWSAGITLTSAFSAPV